MKKCFNCKHGGRQFKLGNKTHLHCGHPKYAPLAESGELSQYDTLMEFADTCDDHLPKEHGADVTNLVIHGCYNCPFSYEYDMAAGYGCKLDDQQRSIKQSKKYQPITPNWCPVRKNKVVVEYDTATIKTDSDQ